jgi:poly(A) polymerase
MFDYDILASIFSYQIHDKAIRKDLPLLIRLEATYQAPPCPIRRLSSILGESIHAAQHIRSDLPLSGKDLSHLILLTKLLNEQPDISVPYQAHKMLYLQGTDMFLDYVLLNAARTVTDQIEQHLSFLHDWKSPVLPVRGKDIMEQGRVNGPQVGILMQELTEWWLQEGCKPTREQCLHWLQDRNNL